LKADKCQFLRSYQICYDCGMRMIFMGSPDFALPSLQECIQQYDVRAVVTQPDRRAGRGRKLTPPAVKALALEHGLPVIQPRSLKDDEIFAQLEEMAADVIVVAAYGQILPPRVLNLPRHGCINVHASLLPRWRGAAPIQASILDGDRETGITIMKMDPGLDTGPILAQEAVPITSETTAGSLSETLSVLGGSLLIRTLKKYIKGAIQPRPQDDELATYAPMLRKADGRLDFNQTAEYLERQIRAYDPWPGSFLTWTKGRILVLRAKVLTTTPSTPIGQVVEQDGYPAVVTTQGILQLIEIQPAGKNPMQGAAYLRGAPDFIGANLETNPA
jgi:methionyl-tRNA formyltransferase